MKYTTAYVAQLKSRKGKPWQARLKYKDPASGKWKETTKMLPEANGKREAQKLANDWLAEMNAVADNMPTMDRDKTVGEMYKDYLSFQFNTGEIERSTYYNSLSYFNEYIAPYLGNHGFATLDKTLINAWLTRPCLKNKSCTNQRDDAN